MPRIRTFIAVEMSPRVISQAAKLIEKLRTATAEINWVRTAQMHLTLKFLGDIAASDTPEICRVVRAVASEFEPFEIICRGVGAFPRPQAPRTLWIGIEDGADELKRLQAAIDDALHAELGYGKERRGFQPHLTIGRVKHAPPGGQFELAKLIEEHARFDADLAVIDEVVTFASFLQRQGATHDALDRAELG